MSKLITVEIHSNGVADVRLNQPEKYNSLSPKMFEAITETGELLSINKSVRAIVLSGNGRGFCAGLHIDSFKKMVGSTKSSITTKSFSSDTTPGNSVQKISMVWKCAPVPVIAALHGVSYGGGLQLALGADIRIAAPDAKFSIMEVQWGLIPDCGITQTLRELVPLDIAKELTFTGRIFGGEEALRLGVITQLSDSPLESALNLAELIAIKSPNAVRASKKLFEATWHETGSTGLTLEEKLQKKLIGSPNQVETVNANFEKRSPQYIDPE